jgi:hypothetical protein
VQLAIGDNRPGSGSGSVQAKQTKSCQASIWLVPCSPTLVITERPEQHPGNPTFN